MPDLALDLRHLRYAMVVAELGSVRRAADALNLSQSTISRRIQSLECRLGVSLFERSRSGARLTLPASGLSVMQRLGLAISSKPSSISNWCNAGLRESCVSESWRHWQLAS
jgi:hypothetical protein